MSADGDYPTRSGATFDASAILSLKGLRRTASLELDSDVETDVEEVAAGAHSRLRPMLLAVAVGARRFSCSSVSRRT